MFRNGVLALCITLGVFSATLLALLIVGLDYCPNAPCPPGDLSTPLPDPLRRMLSRSHVEAWQNASELELQVHGLLAQERTAFATDWLAWLGAVSLLTSIVVATFVWHTLDLQRQANEIAEKNSRGQTRAYVHADAANFYWGGRDELKPRVRITITNTGATPALWYEVRARELILKFEEIPKNFDFLAEVDLPNGFEGPWAGLPSDGEGRHFSFSLDGSRAELHEVAGSPLELQRTSKLFIFGEIRYGTVFGEVYLSQFLFGRSSLPEYEAESEVQRDFYGIDFIERLEKPIALPRLSSRLFMYRRLDKQKR